MTKKHFEAIARTIFEQQDGADANRDTIKETAQRLANEFAGLNPRFDRDKFLTACGF